MATGRRTKKRLKDRNKIRQGRSLAKRRKSAREAAAQKRSRNRAKIKRRNRVSRGKKR